MSEPVRFNFLRPKHAPPNNQHPAKRRWWLRIVIAGALTLTAISGIALSKESRTEPDTPQNASAAGDFSPSVHRFFKKIKSFFGSATGNLTGEERDRINILLLGQGGPGHDGPFLTDTIILASVKPSTGAVALLSVPRDLAAPIPSYGWFRVNSANAFGENEKPGRGGEFAGDVLSTLLDEPIDYYVRVDFTAFEEIIDEVGGIDIEVDRAFVDQQFPTGTDTVQVISFNAGAQHMDGIDALRYARSRHGNNGEGSDFARAKRQQKVLLALKEKMLSLGTITNPARIKRMLSTLDDHVATNAGIKEIIQFIALSQSIDSASIKTHVLTNAEDDLLMNTTVNGAFLLQPRAGNYSDIHALVDAMFDAEPRAVPQAPEPLPLPGTLKMAIYNGTWRAGLAGRWQKWLQEQGFTVPIIGNTPERPLNTTQLILRDATAKKQAQPLEEIFGVLLTAASSTPLLEETPELPLIILLGEGTPEPN